MQSNGFEATISTSTILIEKDILDFWAEVIVTDLKKSFQKKSRKNR